MTRPKVPDDKRIRTAQACESCKRRKQKCNGLKPCNTCTKRNLVCDYLNSQGHGHSSSNGGQNTIVVSGSSPSKRRRSTPDTIESAERPDSKRANSGDTQTAHTSSHQTSDTTTESSKMLGLTTPVPPPSIHSQPAREPEFESHSRQSTTSGGDEVAEVYTETRMLQDPTGRLLYLGDSSTLSFLQFIRMIVESVDGPSQFTMDPSRYRLMELTSTLPPDTRSSLLLPDRRTADILIKSYLINTNSLIEVFDRKAFMRQLNVCFENPLAAEPTFLCLLYLVFAIGLVLATPPPGGEEELIIRKLQTGQTDRAEVFFRNAKCLCDPTSGFEDADFWSVQALLLMSVYMLAKTKRNAAYAYHGMAVRSGYALGLHRQETMVIFPISDRVVRRNVWRSLYVLDRFLAASLGRPTSISEEDCSAEALVTPERYVGQEKYLVDTNTDPSSSGGLNAAVRSCQVIGIILKKVYAQRKISTRLAQDISDQCKDGPQKYFCGLHWQQVLDKTIDPAHGMAVLHVNLLYCHAVILLTRPFFLFLLNRMQQQRLGMPRPVIRPGSKMEKFSEACVNASYHTVALVHMGYIGKYLPQRNPFIIHFLFAAALIVQSSEFGSLHQHPGYADTYQKAIAVLSYCAKTDPQAGRVVYIMSTFHMMIVARAPATSSLRDPSSIPTTPPGFLSIENPDPMANFFLSSNTPPAARNPTPGTAFNPAAPSQPRQQQQTTAAADLDGGGMGPSAVTPITSAGGDLLSEAEWFHFDTLWENWAGAAGGGAAGAGAAGGGGAGGGGAGGGGAGGGPGASSAMAASSLFSDTALGGFGGVGAGGQAFPPSPMPDAQGGVGSVGNVPLYPMMRFSE